MNLTENKILRADITELVIFEGIKQPKDGTLEASSYEIDNNTINITANNKIYSIEFSPLNSSEIEAAYNAVKNNPYLCQEIISGVIPKAFIYNLMGSGVPVLPLNNTQLKFVGNYIDNEQDQVLAMLESLILKDVSIILELRGVIFDTLHDKASEVISQGKYSDTYSLVNKESNNLTSIENIYRKIHLNPLNIEKLFVNFPQNPLFFERKEFKIKVQQLYETVSNEFENVFITGTLTPVRNTDFYMMFKNENQFDFFITPTNNFEFYLKSKGSMYRPTRSRATILNTNENNFESCEKDGLVMDSATVYDYFLSFDDVINNPDFSEICKFLNILFLTSKELVKNLYFKPEIIQLGEQDFTIRYVSSPDTDILKYFDYLKTVMPCNIGFSADGSKLLSKESIKKIIDDIVNYIVNKTLSLKMSKIKIDPVSAMFVQNKPVRRYRSQHDQYLSIKNWLNYFDSENNAVKIRITLEEIKDYICALSVKCCIDGHKYVEFSDIINDDEQSIYSSFILKKLAKASESIENIKDIIFSNGFQKPEISIIEAIKLFSKNHDEMKSLGLEFSIPKEFKNIIKPKASIKASIKNSQDVQLKKLLASNRSNFSLQEIMEFSYEVSLGDETISKEEFLKLVSQSEELVKYKDKYVLLNPDEISKLIDKLNKPFNKTMNSLEFIHSTLSGNIDDFVFDYDDTILEVINNHLKISDIALPEKLKGILRAYQVNGFKWLYSNALKGFGSCIADDMGLGKTVQVISLLLKMKEDKHLSRPAMVICPTTLVGNWKKECEKFAPEIKTSIYHGMDRKLDMKADLIITTYGLLRIDNEIFNKEKWGLLIIDEAQNIKNPMTAQSLAVKSLNTDYHIAMTGTPVENRLSELWSIFDFINKGYLGTISKFQQNYAQPIERSRDAEAAEKLKLITSPFILRRLKTDKSIIDDLPEKMITDEYCYLAPEQAALYEKTINDSFKEIEKVEGIARRGNILKLITALKQICNHPSNYLKNNDYSKDLSGKMLKTISILENILENKEKTLLFTQYKEMGEILEKIIYQELGTTPQFFHGSLTTKARENMIKSFQEEEENKIMIISLKAGGTGLNLTAATNVIHYDLWWNPAVENQATDRTYRIGQTENVSVHRLITIGTFEEKIDELLKEKKSLVDLSLYTGEKMLTELSNDEIFEIFSLR